MYTCFFKFHIDFRQAQPLYYILQKSTPDLITPFVSGLKLLGISFTINNDNGTAG